MDRRLAITIRGTVQGVGFRPFVYNAAVSAELDGWVVNQSDAVRIEVQGLSEAVTQFVNTLRENAPPQATIVEMDVRPLECLERTPSQERRFEIRVSDDNAIRRPTIPPDLSTCNACRDEIASVTERRYRYAFTNCTNCGPRWSIIEGLPYDRPLTSMHGFTMCSACQSEYSDPRDRRFHAQPIACPTCGPTLRLLDVRGSEQARAFEALQAAGANVRAGAVLAVKGIGGFQLVVDALDNQAVERLRRRKQRPSKPLAVMLENEQAVEAYCLASAFELEQLRSPQAPIMLLRRRASAMASLPLADSVAPGNPFLGVMLPNTPLHELLLAEVKRPIVCTSGNRSEEPMAIRTSDACRRLADIADLILTHDRPLVRPVDDSVCREDDGQLQILRRARGFAPVPVPLGRSAPTTLAVGGHLKNTVALALDRSVVVSAHVGDLDNTLGMDVHRKAIADLLNFFDVQPDVIACDLHPDYSSTRHAEHLAQEGNCRLVRVQHHHAHVLSAMAEHQLDGPVLGFAWDGTGYGLDGTIWGGEALLVDRSAWSRVAHLRPFPLPGGDRAAREPRRSAFGLLYESMGIASADIANAWFEPAELEVLLRALQKPRLFPRTSSMGRLFDAVAALCAMTDHVSYEGEAAIGLEHVAAADTASYPIPLVGTEPLVADWREMIGSVIADRGHGVSVAQISSRFHNALADLALRIAQRVECPRIVLTGGCFQNRQLTQRTRARLSEAGFEVYTQRLVPPGDGGISLGQILGAIHQVGE